MCAIPSVSLTGVMKMDLDPLWQLQPPDMFDKEPVSDEDIVMLCKQFWSSSTLAQPPLVFLPASVFAKLNGPCPSTANARRELSGPALKEYRKTAKEAGSAPWNMKKAEAYLHKLCDMSVDCLYIPPPKVLPWLMGGGSRFSGEITAVPDGWSRYAPGPPVSICVRPVPTPCGRGRGRGAGARAAASMGGEATATGGGSLKRKRSVEASSDALILPDDDIDGPGVVQLPRDPASTRPVARRRLHGKQTVSGMLVLGCGKCKRSRKGCAQCRGPKFKGKRGS